MGLLDLKEISLAEISWNFLTHLCKNCDSINLSLFAVILEFSLPVYKHSILTISIGQLGPKNIDITVEIAVLYCF